MTIDETIERFTSNAEYERTHGSLQGCLEFRQLADWLRDYKRLLEQEPTGHWIIMGDRYIKCSECGHITKTESPDIYNFCMVCGANMSGNPTDLPSVNPQEPTDEALHREREQAYMNGYEDASKRFRQEPQTGHWKRISMDRYTTHAHYWYKCDKCGEHNLGNTDYCPSCGCRMIEPQERSE